MMTVQLCEESSSRVDRALPDVVFHTELAELSPGSLQKEWRMQLQSLQEWICVLLAKNQQLRMELMEAQAKLLRKDNECGG